ncbi:EamA family transporter [Agrobacterium vitis]|uniref:EamA family transporter n=1 Tax=Agrobacterium vitis TaxID=373 RepID=UPI0012E80E9F|nr:EamA family transporter [Agrobacterium vitis]MVA22905.1 EamA family transporter [Agrobacterium vitis]
MKQGLDLSMLALILFCILTETGREICFKKGAATGDARQMVLRPVVWAGICFWLIELLAWSRVLASVSLSIAFPIMAMSYATITIAGAVIFKESINLRHAVGVALVTAGVVCVGATGL